MTLDEIDSKMREANSRFWAALKYSHDATDRYIGAIYRQDAVEANEECSRLRRMAEHFSAKL